jgi:hypothetical protein
MAGACRSYPQTVLLSGKRRLFTFIFWEVFRALLAEAFYSLPFRISAICLLRPAFLVNCSALPSKEQVTENKSKGIAANVQYISAFRCFLYFRSYAENAGHELPFFRKFHFRTGCFPWGGNGNLVDYRWKQASIPDELGHPRALITGV